MSDQNAPDKVADPKRTYNIIKQIAANCVERNDLCHDYGGNGAKAHNMAMNYFCGAASMARINGDTDLENHLTKVIVLVSIRGMKAVRELANA